MEVVLKTEELDSLNVEEAEPAAGTSTNNGVSQDNDFKSEPCPEEEDAGPRRRQVFQEEELEESVNFDSNGDSGYSDPVLNAEADRLASLDLPSDALSKPALQVIAFLLFWPQLRKQ